MLHSLQVHGIYCYMAPFTLCVEGVTLAVFLDSFKCADETFALFFGVSDLLR